jgi:BirA family transcriptional regulator, biotin operon repressor / biotin---[acetyl-CoA-carboxylase] ligase
VNLAPAYRDEIDQAVVDLAEMGVVTGRNQLLAACLEELDQVVSVLREQGFAALREDWMQARCLRQSPGQTEYAGWAVIDGTRSGNRRIRRFRSQDDHGNQRVYSGGEIHLRPLSEAA